MRLICPNCDAQYEVPDNVVPASGRDVQCSNCGQTWFQHHADHMPEEDEVVSQELAPDLQDADEETAPPPQAAPAQPPQPERRKLDPAVADILRQEAEAEFEARQRRAQEQSLESQPDLGLETEDYPQPTRQDASEFEDEVAPDNGARQHAARQRMARLRGEPSEDAAEATAQAAALSSRRQLLPDIEEINSTLRSDTTRTRGPDVHAGADLDSPRRKRPGFKRGFLLMLLILVALAAIYIYAPQISEAVPQAEPSLSSYVTWVDQMRINLDVQLRKLLEWLDSLATQAPDAS